MRRGHVGYDTRGMAFRRTDPLGRRTLTKFDDLGRQVATVENASGDFDLARDIAWRPGANGAPGRWAVDPTRLSASDANRVTSYVYDASGNIVRMVAHAPGASGGERVQVTEYEYGTTAAAWTGSSTDPMASLVASKELLSAVRYPDESTGLPGAGDAFTVRYAYNRLGELRATTDQNGTRHDYQRDAAGRVTRDSVGALGAGIDGAVRAITVSYDAAGRMREVRSTRDAAGTQVDSGVGFTYTPLWQVASVVQHPTGAALAANGTPAAGSRSVSYAYSTVLPSTAATPPATGDNFSRLSTTTYPTTSTVVTQTYASGVDARLSRVSGLSLNSPNGTRYSLASYRRLGMDTFAVVDYPAVDIQLDRTWSPSDRKRRTNGWTSQAAGVYPGLDRFGRVVAQSWLDGVTGSTAAGYRPAIVDQIHTYDLASNRLSKRDGRAGASWAGRDWEYGYDRLDRLLEARQGARTGVTNSSQGTWIPAAGGQEWVLDMLGNWTEQRTDLTGNGVFTDALDRSDARSHNLANELTQRVVSPTAGGTTSTNSVTLPLAYDAAGNLEEESTSASTKRRYVMEAVAAAAAPSGVTSTRGGCRSSRRKRHVGLHWRIEKHWHAVPDAANLADRKTTFWYDAAWRVVQETQRDQTNGAGTLEESILQQVWGIRYIDDAVARMRVTGNGSGGVAAGASQELAFQLTDAQFSVIAVATPGKPGVVIDRIAYSPYGEATRTLRSDVNGDGFVNQSDYSGVIKPRTGAAIGTASYVVEADLDRDGKITQTDYDISIADDGKSSSGGVGEAGLFSRGVRNSIGYCGYIFNEDSGLYTVRFRTYSPTLGRWLERDPAGYVDGMGLYEYVRGGAISAVDPSGLHTGWLMQREVVGGAALPSSGGAGCSAIGRALPIGVGVGGVGITVVSNPWSTWDDVYWEDGVPVVPQRPARAQPRTSVRAKPGAPLPMGQKCPEPLKRAMDAWVERACPKDPTGVNVNRKCRPSGYGETLEGCKRKLLEWGHCWTARHMRQTVCFTPEHPEWDTHWIAVRDSKRAFFNCLACVEKLGCCGEK